jgi:hypothetical protein
MGAPKSAPTPIITRRVPQSVFAAAIKPISAPSTMKTMTMSFRICMSPLDERLYGNKTFATRTMLSHKQLEISAKKGPKF